jgi:uncharacterized protein (DUF433 family)
MNHDRFLGGCYEASRAAALSGVPKSTVYDWARKGVVVPSVSPTQEKLWSYADLMTLRIVAWLRHGKGFDEHSISRSSMRQVRAALDVLSRHGTGVWDVSGGPLLVERSGRVLVRLEDGVHDPATGATVLPDPLDSFGLTAPFTLAGAHGPDLLRPRPHLRIEPGKVSGEPHVVGTRITTTALASLAAEGYGPDSIAAMYNVSLEVVEEAKSLEEQLGTFLVAA